MVSGDSEHGPSARPPAYRRKRVSLRVACEYHDDSGQWFRAYGNENRQFDPDGLTRRRLASINEHPIAAADRKFFWLLGRRPDGHPASSEFSVWQWWKVFHASEPLPAGILDLIIFIIGQIAQTTRHEAQSVLNGTDRRALFLLAVLGRQTSPGR